ncbi:hypothetical protein CV770_11355 [Bradyrhizobium sp. AC87j1]|nr:hypothetical protein CV770_11355 [Bradyrhizobium sp. AC87j1]
MIVSITQRISVLEDGRRAFQTSCTSTTRLLSELQPYAHAALTARSGGAWLPAAALYLPEKLQSPDLTLLYETVRRIYRASLGQHVK